MPVISICSPKGGVGKTTMTANLAYIFARAGINVVAVDLDPQNALRLYFGDTLSDDRGLINKIDTDHANWMEAVRGVDKNLYMLPYGKSSLEQRSILDGRLADPTYLKTFQSGLFCNPDILVLADFPPGFSLALKSINEVTDLTLLPLLADAASISLFSQIQSGQLTDGAFGGKLGYYIVLNQIDKRIRLNREVQDFAVSNFKDRLLGMIHADTSVIEAAALQQPVVDFNQNSAAAYDYKMLAEKVGERLGYTFSQGSVTVNPLS